MTVARRMWRLYEPVHAVTYFTPAARAAYEQAGLRGFWRGYFAGRAAPLGPVGPGPVQATFFGFRRQMIERALPDVWSRLAPPDALRARLDGARRALADALGEARATPGSGEDPAAGEAGLTEAAALLRAAAETVELAGRPLAAANLDLPWPDDPLGTLWQAATVLREQRGDGHVAALLVHGLDGAESLVWRAAIDVDRTVLQPARGWSDDEWAAARERLAARGWLAPDGTATATALTARDEIERITDDLAAGPWRRLGEDRVARLAELLRPVSTAAAAAISYPNPIGLPR